MRCLEIYETPEVILENYDRWVGEYKYAMENGGNVPAPYRDGEIKDALVKETGSKCAYCESFIEHVSYSHVEHIIPKTIYPEGVCLWTNLTLACQVCNTNKGNYYSEEAPILNPYQDDVESELTFYGPMAIERGDRGKLTIRKLRLNRNALMFKRAESIEGVVKIMDLMERTVDKPAYYLAMLEDLKKKVSDFEEYTHCVRCFVRDELYERSIPLEYSEIKEY